MEVNTLIEEFKTTFLPENFIWRKEENYQYAMNI